MIGFIEGLIKVSIYNLYIGYILYSGQFCFITSDVDSATLGQKY